MDCVSRRVSSVLSVRTSSRLKAPAAPSASTRPARSSSKSAQQPAAQGQRKNPDRHCQVQVPLG
jgi:hypothetical protein